MGRPRKEPSNEAINKRRAYYRERYAQAMEQAQETAAFAHACQIEQDLNLNLTAQQRASLQRHCRNMLFRGR